MVPTIQLGDLSKNFAAEVFEKRGFWGDIINEFTVGDVAALVLTSRAPGGVVIENISAQQDPVHVGNFGAEGFYVLRTTTLPPIVATLLTSPPLPVGGGTPNSEVQRYSFSAGWQSSIVETQFVYEGFKLHPLTWWIPPGAFLIIAQAKYRISPVGIAVASYIELTWREIPEIQGVPE
jgi:hypothetical protein